MMMTRFVLTLVLGVLLGGVFSFVGESQAHVITMNPKSDSNADFVDKANVVSCERTNTDTKYFDSPKIFESWFPKRLFLKRSGWKNIGGQKTIKLVEAKREFRLLPNGKLIGSMPNVTTYGMHGKPGAAHVHTYIKNIRYKCDATAQEVLASQKTAGSVTTVSEKHSRITLVEKRLQELGALTIEPTFTPANGNTDSLGKQLTLSETLEPPQYVGHMFWWASLCKGHRLEGNYNKEWTESFKRLASKKDWALFKSSSFMSDASNPIPKNCSPEKVNQVNVFLEETLSWLEKNKGSNLSNYFKGQSDGVTQAASVGTTSSNKPSGGMVTCERYDTTGEEYFDASNLFNFYQLGETFDTFYPQKIEIEVRSFKGVTGRSILTSKNQTLMANGKLLRVKNKDGVNTNASYKCDKTSIEVAALLDKLEKQPVTEVVKQQTPTKVNDPFAEAKAFCSDLGFTSGTEKHGNCVLKIASNSGSEVAPATNKPETASNENKPPTITIASASSNGPEGTVKGRVTDRDGIAEVRVDGQVVQTDSDGNFTANTYVPASGKEITIEAIDTAALSSAKTVSLKRGQIQQASGPRFDVLDPTAGKRVKRNVNALALIVGISNYKRTDAPAVYADKDAQYFHDYAYLKLGIPDDNIKTMVNAKAEQGDVVLAVKDWMRRSSKPGKTDVYVFFAGHGLASDDGEQMYLLPYDGRPRLLDKTAILRQELFDDIASANPRSVTVFLDTCYSGTTRGTDMLIASRPIAIKALKQSVPDNFTVMTAARGDQTAKPLEEAKHGMFSYFLMKGMEGLADSNQDNKITAGELHQYVQSNVVQQSSGSQTPELQGDAERVLVRFQ